MAELADALGSGPNGSKGRAGSSPVIRIRKRKQVCDNVNQRKTPIIRGLFISFMENQKIKPVFNTIIMPFCFF